VYTIPVIFILTLCSPLFSYETTFHTLPLQSTKTQVHALFCSWYDCEVCGIFLFHKNINLRWTFCSKNAISHIC